MGIPKFFRWMNDRYPGLLVVAKERELPEIDNFYLDMNGIIHNCTHPCDGDVHFRISEEEMFEDIFNYVTTLFDIIRPKQYFFLAVDGVAPRAKMNQQRGRRFRSAKEASDREEAAKSKGDILPSADRFDSNCITPGTEFMVRLSVALRKFITRKLETDPQWQPVNVILSGHETPGEGEHKVMDFIRYKRSQADYNPDTRHCLYGLDTDLIMLALCSHEPNFILLREEIKFNRKEASRGKSQRVDPSRINFNVLFLKRLRQNIRNDFITLRPHMSFKFDLEAIIDDWILICFLVGNDFIPHIPHFHIHKNALPRIFEVYQETLVKLDGYLNENGVLNLRRFRTFAKALSEADFENYRMLVKENGGECAKDDFSKLNMFVKHKMKVVGARVNGENTKENHWRRNKYSQNHQEDFSRHTYHHQAGIWYNIHNKHSKQQHHVSTNSGTNGTSTNQVHRRQVHTTPRLNNSGRGQNGLPTGGRGVGVHSFTEEQLNNSITVCADGDIIDLSDEEFLSDEKFPDSNGRQVRRNIDYNGRMGRRSTPKSNHKDLASKKSDDWRDFQAYKRTYYREKLKLDPDKETILKVVHEYVRALQWNLHYYYHGCISWGWYYPYHYAPFISDIVQFKLIDTKFEMGEPFKPYDQLLSVLPAASLSLLPKLYRGLVTAANSPLAKYFPTEIEYDLNGKQNDWEAVVLAPFIDQEALLNATMALNWFLSERERSINKHGPHLLFHYERAHNASNNRYAPRGVAAGRVKCIEISSNGFFLPMDKIKFGLLKKAKNTG